MSLLQDEPRSPGSIDDLLTTAWSESAGARRAYAALADRMRGAGREDLAAILSRLSEEEAGIEAVLKRHAAQGAPMTPSSDSGSADLENLDSADAELVDSYALWAMAVRNADRAFARWTYAAAHAPTPDVRAAAESLARFHLALAGRRRMERRRAFPARGASAAPLSLGRLEAHLSGLLACHELRDGPFFEPRLAEAAQGARKAALRLEKMAPIPVRPLTEEALGSPAILAEAIVEGYFDGVKTAATEDALWRLQAGAADAVQRLDILRRTQTQTPRTQPGRWPPDAASG